MTTAVTKTDRQRLAEELEQFIAFRNGCDQVFRHWLGFKFTDGVKYVADKAGAHWLIDAIGSYQPSSKLRSNQRLQEFQLWELKVDLEAKTAVLEASLIAGLAGFFALRREAKPEGAVE